MPNSGHDGEWFETTPAFWALHAQRSIIAFKLWYADGSTVCGVPSEWGAAPATGVQVLMVYFPRSNTDRTERMIVSGRDAYTLPVSLIKKLGLMIEYETFERIQQAAMTDQWRP